MGAGLIAVHKHLPAWSRLGRRVTLAALCDVDATRCAEVARQFGVPRTYSDLRLLLETERPDVVDICTPPRHHAAAAVQALRGGAHVLIEKPMAISTEECDAIITAAAEAGRQVCTAHSDLFYPAFIEARKRARNGAIGEFRGMRILLSTPTHYMTSVADHWAHSLPGGVIGETGPHAVYLTLAFVNPILDVRLQARKLLPEFPWSRFEDYRIDLVGNDAVCSVTLAYATNHWAAQVDLWGTAGFLKVDLESQSLVRYRRAALAPWDVGLTTLGEAAQVTGRALGTAFRFLVGRFRGTHEVLIRRFHESVRDGTPSPVSAQEGREAVRVMTLIRDRLDQARG